MNNLGEVSCACNGCWYYNKKNNVYFFNNCSRIQYNKFIPKFDHVTYCNCKFKDNKGFPIKYNYLIKGYEDTLVLDEPCDINVIIVRDFRNMLASRYKKYCPTLGLDSSYIQDFETLKSVWKQFVKTDKQSNIVFINYDKWLTSKVYRNKISIELGISNTHDNINYVSEIGEGSSFIGLRLESDKQQYLTRYKQIDLPFDLNSDDELSDLLKIHFN